MTESFNDPRRLFRLWKELTGEDLLQETKNEEDRVTSDNDKKNQFEL